MLGLYLHIPFCSSICGYCNFTRGLLDPDLKVRYVAALDAEIRQAGRAAARPAADTVFFGGGTPSLLEPAEVARLLQACADAYELSPTAEITLETNPETVTPERLSAFREAGVNRISFGVQSFDDEELVRLGRRHSAARAIEAVRTARASGFDNLSFDLMLWLPGQSFASWMRTVAQAIALGPDHLSLYLLELYPNAPLRESRARQASDDEAADMYLAALDELDAAGFAQYEISNVARPGFASRHNLKYWRSGDWQGCGAGAHSTIDGVRWRNVAGTDDYIERMASDEPVGVDRRTLSASERIEEALFTGLRLSEGIDGRNFEHRFGVDPWTRHGDALDPYLHDGLMWRRGASFGLSRRGMLVANEILATFV
jgi:oxygen-independent coproporphyrinogen-3 oxidase